MGAAAPPAAGVRAVAENAVVATGRVGRVLAGIAAAVALVVGAGIGVIGAGRAGGLLRVTWTALGRPITGLSGIALAGRCPALGAGRIDAIDTTPRAVTCVGGIAFRPVRATAGRAGGLGRVLTRVAAPVALVVRAGVAIVGAGRAVRLHAVGWAGLR